MTVKRVQAAARARGLYFDGERKWINSMIGYGYEIYVGDSKFGWLHADTLNGLYDMLQQFPRLSNRNELVEFWAYTL